MHLRPAWPPGGGQHAEVDLDPAARRITSMPSPKRAPHPLTQGAGLEYTSKVTIPVRLGLLVVLVSCAGSRPPSQNVAPERPPAFPAAPYGLEQTTSPDVRPAFDTG